VINEDTTASSKTLPFGLLLDMTDYHVHAVYDPEDPYPISACGVTVVPGIWLPGPILLCRGCLADVHDDVELRPASSVRRRVLAADPDNHAGPVLALCRWYLARQYDRAIQRVLASGWHR
jgi:hypothetical protein